MSDQPISNQPTLSPEEELDILEAVYKIGKEKGLDLLRPEQIKKLVDAGRLREELQGERDEENFVEDETVVDSIVRSAKNAVMEIIAGRYSSDDWVSFTDHQKDLLVVSYMYVYLGVSPEMLKKRVWELMKGVL